MSKYQIEGTVETMSRDGKGIKIDGQWYSSWKPISDAVQYKEDVRITVQDKEKNGTVYKNIKGVVTNLTTGATIDSEKGTTGGVASAPRASSGGATAPAPAPRVNFPIASGDRDRSIIRRHAVSAATELCKLMGDPINVEGVLAVARVIENYTSGDDLAQALAEEE